MHAHLKPRFAGLAALAALALSACGGGEPAPDAPLVTAFAADQDRVETGETVTLSWQTEHAESVALTYGNDLSVDLTGLDPAGSSVEVRLDAPGEVTFTLTATGVEGTDPTTATASVNVVEPPEPTIDVFTASPETILEGNTVTLTWKTSEADAVVITETGDETLSTAVDPEGSVEVTPTVDTTYTLTATGRGGEATDTVSVVVQHSPTIDTFVATRAGAAVSEPVVPGTEVTLEWETSHVDEVVLTDSHGTTLPATTVDGTITVTPAISTTYTLNASGEAGEVSATVDVQVIASVTTFAIAPSTDGQGAVVRAGDEVTLSWTTEGATSLAISGPGEFTHTTTDPVEMAAGSITTTVASSGSFILELQPSGTFSSAMVAVDVTDAPRVRTLTVAPDVTTAGESVDVTWTADGAETIVLTATHPTAGETLVDTGAVNASGDTVTVPLPEAGEWTLTLEAGNSLTTEKHVRSTTVEALPAPAVVVFAAEPLRTPSGGDVTLSWETAHADSVKLLKDDIEVLDFPGTLLNGTFTDTLTTDSRYVLVAMNALGAETRSAPIDVTAGAPEVVSFTSSLDYAPTSEDITLSWEVLGGRTLTITQAGVEVCSAVGQAEIAAGECSVTTPPTTGTYEYTLTLDDNGTADTATLSVDVTDGPIIRRVEASSNIVTAGTDFTLYAVVDADAAGTDPTFTLEDQDGTDYSASVAPSTQGGYDYEAPLNIADAGIYTFTLTASTPDTTPASDTVTVEVAAIPAVLSFTTSEDVLDTDAGVISSTLSWTTEGGATFRIYELDAAGERVGDPIVDTTDPTAVAAGSHEVSPSGTITYEAEVINGAGTAGTAQVGILVDLPVVDAFTVAQGTSTGAVIDAVYGEPVTLTWTTRRGGTLALSPTPHVWTRTYGTFADISGNSTVQDITPSSLSNKNVEVRFPAGFVFPFTGEDLTKTVVGTDGYLGWGFSTYSYLSDKAIPNDSAPDGLVAAFWDGDLYGEDWTRLLWDRVTDDQTDAIVVQWDHHVISRYGLDRSDLNFQTWLHANGDVEIRYGDMMASDPLAAAADEALIGLEYLNDGDRKTDDLDAIQVSYQQPILGGLAHTGYRFPAQQPDVAALAVDSDSVEVTPSGREAVYTLFLENANGSTSQDVTVRTWPDLAYAAPVFTATEDASAGSAVELTWTVIGADSAQVLHDGTPVEGCASEGDDAVSGSCTVTPTAAGVYSYTLAYSNPVSEGTAALDVEVFEPLAVESFTANGSSEPVYLNPGDALTLAWDVTGAQALVVLDGFGNDLTPDAWSAATPDGSVTLDPPPTRTTIYRLYIGDDADFSRMRYAEIFVWVNDTTVDTLTADSLQAYPGEAVTLSWSASSTAKDVRYVFGPAHEMRIEPNGFASLVDDPASKDITPFDADEALVDLDLGQVGFLFPFYGEHYRTFQVSTNGWLGFGTGRTSADSSNYSIPSSSGPEGILAAFWDDLVPYQGDRARSRLLYRVAGAPGHRTLTVEWHGYSLDHGGYWDPDTPGTVTVQAVVDEQGLMEVRFLELAGDPAADPDDQPDIDAFYAGDSATVGWENADASEGYRLVYNDARPDLVASNVAHTFRTPDVEATGSRTVHPTETTTYEVCATGDGLTRCKEVTIQVVQPGDVAFTELMIAPSAGTSGEWVELRNLTDRDIDIEGWTLSDGVSTVTVPTGTPYVLASGEYAVFAATTGAVPATVNPLSLGGVQLDDAAGGLELMYGPTSIDTVAWDTQAGWVVTPDVSLMVDPSLHRRDVGALNDAPTETDADGVVQPVWCDSQASDSWNGILGSPGLSGYGCRLPSYSADFLGSSMPFIDIETTGQRLHGVEGAPGDQGPEPFAHVTLGFAFPFFDTAYSEAWVSSNGFVAFEELIYGTDEMNYHLDSAAYDTIAPFWDDLHRKLDPDTGLPISRAYYELRTVGARQVAIIQWCDFTADTLGMDPGTVTFQVQLWDDGEVVFAYDTMEADDPDDAWAAGIHTGRSATIGMVRFGQTADEVITYAYEEAGSAYSGLSLSFLPRP